MCDLRRDEMLSIRGGYRGSRNDEMKRRVRKTIGDVCSVMFIVTAAINGDWDLIVLDQLFSCILSSNRIR